MPTHISASRPRQVAYNFSELIEGHAVDTYGEFVDANEKLLKQMPPPYVALSYYRGSDLYLVGVTGVSLGFLLAAQMPQADLCLAFKQ